MISSYAAPLTPSLLLDVVEYMNKTYAEEIGVNVMWGFFQFGTILSLFKTK